MKYACAALCVLLASSAQAQPSQCDIAAGAIYFVDPAHDDWYVCIVKIPPPAATDYGGYRPHLQGFGATSIGGRGDTTKIVCAVNSLLATAGTPTLVTTGHYRGTLRQCIDGVNASYIVFETSGTIDMGGCLFITQPYLTIAGQTAPSPGVTLKNGCLRIDSHDVVLQHIRIRPGAAVTGVEAIQIRGANEPAYNVIIDHASDSWSAVGGLGVHAFGGPNPTEPTNILVADSIISETLNYGHGFLTFGRPTGGNITIVRNLFAHNGNRNPWIASGWRASVLNNVTYDAHTIPGTDGQWGSWQVVGTGPDYPEAMIEAAYIGNTVIDGPSAWGTDKTMSVTMDAAQVTAGGAKLYLLDNLGPVGCAGTTSAAQFTNCVRFIDAATAANSECSQTCFDSTFGWHTAFMYQVKPRAEAQTSVLANAGARPLDRDAVDTRVVADVTQLDGDNIPNEAAVGGYPTLAVNSQLYVIPANPHVIDSGQTRPNIERDLETKARAVEP